MEQVGGKSEEGGDRGEGGGGGGRGGGRHFFKKLHLQENFSYLVLG